MSQLVRIGHSGIYLDDKIYLFGGYIQNPDTTSSRYLIYTNDFIEINITDQLWTNLNNTIVDQILIPSPRNCHSFCLKNRNEMILFGGKSNGFHKDVWLYEIDKNLWTRLEIKSGLNLISARYGQSAVNFKDHLFVFGGYDSNGKTSNELFKLNLTKLEWNIVQVESKSTISGRYHHASVLNTETGEWYIHGGKTANSIVNDTIKISLDSLVETETFIKCNAEIIASNLSETFARYGHSMVLEGNKLYSIGGCNQLQDFTDCACLDLENINSGWKIDTIHPLASIFKESNNEAQPILHSLVQIIDSSDFKYFIVGGYSKTLSDNSTSTIQSDNGLFNIELFNSKLNDDIFRKVLSFLNLQDLMKLHLVSKSLRICKLTTEDQYWKDFYYNTLHDFKQAASKSNRFYETLNYENYSPQLFDSYLRKKENFKANFIEVTREIMKKVDKRKMERNLRIEQIETRLDGKKYYSKSDIVKYSQLDTLLPVNEHEYKVVQVGCGTVGKTSLLITHSLGTFPGEYIPTMADSYSSSFNFGPKTHAVVLWDNAGNEEVDRYRMFCYPNSELILVSFSCISYETFFRVASFYVPEVREKCPGVPVALVCTKIDIREDPIMNKQFILTNGEKPISFEQGELMAKKMGCLTYLETSAKSRIGIDDLTETLLKIIAFKGTDKDLGNGTQKKCLLQ